MILVDTSVWIQLLSHGRQPGLKNLDLLEFATCGPVVQEVFQGLRPGASGEAFQEMLLAIPVLADPIPLDLYVQAAGIYRQGRRKGRTIRSSIDCLIAAIAIANRVPVWHRDRDFDAIASYTALEVVERP